MTGWYPMDAMPPCGCGDERPVLCRVHTADGAPHDDDVLECGVCGATVTRFDCHRADSWVLTVWAGAA